jgi:Protein of unknown function (DUF3261)
MNAARRAWLLAASGVLTGCMLPPRPGRFPEPYALRLSPGSLGRELALQQHMTITVFGHAQQMDLALEADAQAVRLAVLAFGQTVARLDWDGRELKESRAPGFPAFVTGARVLGDVQLVHWPAPAIRAALPPGFSLQAQDGERLLLAGSTPMARVRYPAPGVAELENFPGHYQLRLESVELR